MAKKLLTILALSTITLLCSCSLLTMPDRDFVLTFKLHCHNPSVDWNIWLRTDSIQFAFFEQGNGWIPGRKKLATAQVLNLENLARKLQAEVQNAPSWDQSRGEFSLMAFRGEAAFLFENCRQGVISAPSVALFVNEIRTLVPEAWESRDGH